jgi:hypothetical protein
MIAVNDGPRLERLGYVGSPHPMRRCVSRRNADRSGKGAGVWRPGQHRSIAVRPEDHVVALVEAERIPYRFQDSHLPFEVSLTVASIASPASPLEVRIQVLVVGVARWIALRGN